jgi:hypothetical protein
MSSISCLAMDDLLSKNVPLLLDSKSGITCRQDNFLRNHCRCSLCAWECRRPDTSEDAQKHADSKNHLKKVKEINEALTQYMSLSSDIHKLVVETCDHQPGPKLHAQMLLYLFNETAKRFDPSSLSQIRTLVERLKQDTRLVLLELTLWKSACILNPKEPFKDVLSTILWVSNGWKANKVAMRHHGMVNVVIENVVPFLGEPPSV